MLILKVQFTILNYAQSEGSIASYVQMLHHVQFRIDCRNSLWTFACDICTDPSVYLTFYGIQTYPQNLSNVNIFMTGWNNIRSTYETWKLQQWFGLIFLCVFKIQTMFIIHLFFVSEVYLILWKKNYHLNT